MIFAMNLSFAMFMQNLNVEIALHVFTVVVVVQLIHTVSMGILQILMI